MLYRAKVTTTGADQRLDIEVQCHSILAELCWVEANGKDGQADKDFDEHAKVKKTEVTETVMIDIVGHRSYNVKC